MTTPGITNIEAMAARLQLQDTPVAAQLDREVDTQVAATAKTAKAVFSEISKHTKADDLLKQALLRLCSSVNLEVGLRSYYCLPHGAESFETSEHPKYKGDESVRKFTITYPRQQLGTVSEVENGGFQEIKKMPIYVSKVVTGTFFGIKKDNPKIILDPSNVTISLARKALGVTIQGSASLTEVAVLEDRIKATVKSALGSFSGEMTNEEFRKTFQNVEYK